PVHRGLRYGMNILADENIAAVEEAFGPLGRLTTLPGRSIDRAAVRSANVLLVRSVTAVGCDLLDGSDVRFVGSATAGLDHIDAGWLGSRGITLAHAPGCNATAVAEYVIAAILEIADRRSVDFRAQVLGVVGVGHTGSRVVRLAEALGIPVIQNDPPRAAHTG